MERRSREGSRSGGDGRRRRVSHRNPERAWTSPWRQSVLGQVAPGQDRPPHPRLRSSDAGVRRAGLVAEHGPQSLDVNVLLLKTSTVSTAAQRKAGNEQRSKACPCTHTHTPLHRLYGLRTHAASKASWFLSHVVQPSQTKVCSVHMLTRLWKQISTSGFFCSTTGGLKF